MRFKKELTTHFLFAHRRVYVWMNILSSKMVSQTFEKFTTCVPSNEVRYWVDSGTLLGLTRSNKLIDNDNDIDISIWDKNHKKLQKYIEKEEIQKHFNIKEWSFNGWTFQYGLQPVDTGRPINIKLFREGPDNAFSISFYNPHRDKNTEKHQRPLTEKIQDILANLYTFHIGELYNSTREVNNIFRRNEYFKVWKIPLKYFSDLKYNKAHNVYFPAKNEEYLTFRYEDWKVRDENWNTWTDDGGVSSKGIREFDIFSCSKR